jgi:hypothetical protein
MDIERFKRRDDITSRPTRPPLPRSNLPLSTPRPAAPQDNVPRQPEQQMPVSIRSVNQTPVPVQHVERSTPTKSNHPKKFIWIVLAGVVIAIVLAGGYLWHKDHHKAAPDAIGSSTQSQADSLTPNYTVVEPKNDVKLPIGTFSKALETYGFFDTLDGTQIQVTEQPQMKKYTSIQSEVSSLAKTVNATTPFSTTDGTSYLMSEPGIQTVLSPVSGLLITIVSTTPHSISDWATYVNSLQ